MDQYPVPALKHAGRYLVSLTMATLALFSVYSLSVIGERWWTFRQTRASSVGLLRRVLDHVDAGRLTQALTACEAGRGSHLSAVLTAGLREFVPLESSNPGLLPGTELERTSLAAREAMQRATAAEIERLEQRLTSLATLGNISPFVGLFGTVIGIMRAFEAISRTGSGGRQVVTQSLFSFTVSFQKSRCIAVKFDDALTLLYLFQPVQQEIAQELVIAITPFVVRGGKEVVRFEVFENLRRRVHIEETITKRRADSRKD